MRRLALDWRIGLERQMKLLVNPLCWYMAFQAIGLTARLKHESDRTRARSILKVLLLITLLFAAISTPGAGRALEASLSAPESAKSAFAPAFIFVLGGGYRPGTIPAEDILVEDSERRVLHAVAAWRRNPGAHLVFAGASYLAGELREPDRLVKLMAETAHNLGVPSGALLLEPHSRNTREHPIEALKLPQVNPGSPISVVTSAWHMRRALGEFCRYFQHVRPDGAEEAPTRIGWRDFIPDAGALDFNTTLLREWIGIVWYANWSAPSKC